MTVFDTPDLTKWPRLLVDGARVTADQADEIIIRTSEPFAMLATNDRPWHEQIARLWGLELGPHGFPTFESRDEARERYGLLDLRYLRNNQIASSWIGGPHGWCDWTGRLHTAHYNIGKWPTIEAVTADATLIAATWPFLDMTVQLVPDEGEHIAGPVAEWRIRDGAATYRPLPPGTDPIVPPFAITAAYVGRVFEFGGERGVTIPRLRRALAHTEHRKARTLDSEASKELP
ncbi:hypothetical protein ACFVWN_20465 [Nocardiopsis flavescens]|uniref:hypothetical protein n=1 Tax=Nocardiopsis flavescens TaxID=758803 RepID=UPI00365052E0